MIKLRCSLSVGDILREDAQVSKAFLAYYIYYVEKTVSIHASIIIKLVRICLTLDATPTPITPIRLTTKTVFGYDYL
jgi:hypothetical protein